MKLGQVMVFASDMARMQAFYRDVLGLPPVDESDPGFARYAAGGVLLALHALPAQIAGTIAITDPPTRRDDCAIKITFHVADVTSERARLIAAGVAMTEPFTYAGRVFCDGTDPEGNVFQIATH